MLVRSGSNGSPALLAPLVKKRVSSGSIIALRRASAESDRSLSEMTDDEHAPLKKRVSSGSITALRRSSQEDTSRRSSLDRRSSFDPQDEDEFRSRSNSAPESDRLWAAAPEHLVTLAERLSPRNSLTELRESLGAMDLEPVVMRRAKSGEPRRARPESAPPTVFHSRFQCDALDEDAEEEAEEDEGHADDASFPRRSSWMLQQEIELQKLQERRAVAHASPPPQQQQQPASFGRTWRVATAMGRPSNAFTRFHSSPAGTSCPSRSSPLARPSLV